MQLLRVYFRNIRALHVFISGISSDFIISHQSQYFFVVKLLQEFLFQLSPQVLKYWLNVLLLDYLLKQNIYISADDIINMHQRVLNLGELSCQFQQQKHRWSWQRCFSVERLQSLYPESKHREEEQTPGWGLASGSGVNTRSCKYARALPMTQPTYLRGTRMQLQLTQPTEAQSWSPPILQERL